MKGLVYLGALVLGIVSAGVALFWPGHLVPGAFGLSAAVVVFFIGTVT